MKLVLLCAQVYRALTTPLNQETCRRLLQHLQDSLNDASAASQLAASDVLLTLTVCMFMPRGHVCAWGVDVVGGACNSLSIDINST